MKIALPTLVVRCLKIHACATLIYIPGHLLGPISIFVVYIAHIEGVRWKSSQSRLKNVERTEWMNAEVKVHELYLIPAIFVVDKSTSILLNDKWTMLC